MCRTITQIYFNYKSNYWRINWCNRVNNRRPLFNYTDHQQSSSQCCGRFHWFSRSRKATTWGIILICLIGNFLVLMSWKFMILMLLMSTTGTTPASPVWLQYCKISDVQWLIHFIYMDDSKKQKTNQYSSSRDKDSIHTDKVLVFFKTI